MISQGSTSQAVEGFESQATEHEVREISSVSSSAGGLPSRGAEDATAGFVGNGDDAAAADDKASSSTSTTGASTTSTAMTTTSQQRQQRRQVILQQRSFVLAAVAAVARVEGIDDTNFAESLELLGGLLPPPLRGLAAPREMTSAARPQGGNGVGHDSCVALRLMTPTPSSSSRSSTADLLDAGGGNDGAVGDATDGAALLGTVDKGEAAGAVAPNGREGERGRAGSQLAAFAAASKGSNEVNKKNRRTQDETATTTMLPTRT